MTSDRSAPESAVDVVVSIASHDSLDVVCECLSTLPSACSDLRWTAVVVLNVARPDDAVIEARFPWATVVRNPTPRGFGANHNAALAPFVERGRARYALVLNDDTSLSPGSVTTLVACADAHPEAGVIGPKTYSPDGTRQPVYYSFPRLLRSLSASVSSRIPLAVPIEQGRGWLRGSCLLFRLDALRQIGLFDTRYFLFFEDTDICDRLWNGGWHVMVCEQATITHAAHSTVSRPELVDATRRHLLRSQYLYHHEHDGPVAAYLLAQANRIGLLSRAASRLVFHPRGTVGDQRTEARQLMDLAAYGPADLRRHDRLGTEPIVDAGSPT